MPTLFLGLAIHNHQPVGNHGFVFEQAFHDAYLPLVEALERQPHVRLSLHYSGSLLDWLLTQHPEFIERVARLAAAGQVEMMTGGYYEPVLSMIPDTDKLGQIEKMSAAVRDLFGQEPQGLWLAERVWEPSLPLVLGRAGVQWTVVDDVHFRLAGVPEEDLVGSFLTEEQGQAIKVFPSRHALRYSIPWWEVPDVIEYLRGWAGDEGRILVMGDDGEKFGSWPTTFEHCWRRGWMDRFFQALADNRDWLTVIPLGEHAARYPARGLVYIPTASYDEMMEWALPADASAELTRLRRALTDEGRQEVLRYLGGGFWRNFFRKYPEANAMHKKMLRVHEKVHAAADRGDNTAALNALWAAQCNCPYWHGVFGGLYLNHIRTATHSNLVRAEREADTLLRGPVPWIEVRSADFDLDGREEVLVQFPQLSVLVVPALGGALKEWDLRTLDWSLLTVITRRPEAYHQALRESAAAEQEEAEALRSIHDEAVRTKEAGLEAALRYDSRDRLAWQEQVLPADTSFAAFVDGACEPLCDLAIRPFQTQIKREAAGVRLRLIHEAGPQPGPEGPALAAEKLLLLSRRGTLLRCETVLRNAGEQPLDGLLVSEWNLNLPGGARGLPALRPAGNEPFPLGEPAVLSGVERFTLEGDGGVRLACSAEPPVAIWCFPVRTVSSSEGGLEQVTQGYCLAAVLPLQLKAGDKARLSLTWEAASRP